MLLLTAFVDVTSVILLYRITLQTSILNGISESGTPATYADMLLIIINKSLKRASIIILGVSAFATTLVLTFLNRFHTVLKSPYQHIA